MSALKMSRGSREIALAVSGFLTRAKREPRRSECNLAVQAQNYLTPERKGRADGTARLGLARTRSRARECMWTRDGPEGGF